MALVTLPSGILAGAIAPHLDAPSAIALAGTCRAIRREMRRCVLVEVDADEPNTARVAAALARGTIAGCTRVRADADGGDLDVLRAAVAFDSPPKELDVTGDAARVGETLVGLGALGASVETLSVDAYSSSTGGTSAPFEGIDRVARAFPNVVTLRLGNFSGNPDGADGACGAWARVRSLKIVNPNVATHPLPRPLPSLETLEIECGCGAPPLIDLGVAYPNLRHIRILNNSYAVMQWLNATLAILAKSPVRVDLTAEVWFLKDLFLDPRALGAVRRVRITYAHADRGFAEVAASLAMVPMTIETLYVNLDSEDAHFESLPLPEAIVIRCWESMNRNAAARCARWLRETSGSAEIRFESSYHRGTMTGEGVVELLRAAAARASRWHRDIPIDPKLAPVEAAALAASGCSVVNLAFYVRNVETDADAIAALHPTTCVRFFGLDAEEAQERLRKRARVR